MKKAAAFFLFFTLFAVFPAIITFAQNIQEGNATWYEDNSQELNASHARLPPGTTLRVTNLNNNKEIYVTVTDRIQLSDNRVLDLSQAAATALGMNKKGSTPIRLVVERGLLPEPKTAAAPTPAAPTPPAPRPPAPRPPAPPPDLNPYKDEPVPDFNAVSASQNGENQEVDYSQYVDYGDFVDYDDFVENVDYDDYDDYDDETSLGSASQAQPEQTPQPQTYWTQGLLKKVVVLINGKEETLEIPDSVYIPFPVSGPTPFYSLPPPQPAPTYQPFSPPWSAPAYPQYAPSQPRPAYPQYAPQQPTPAYPQYAPSQPRPAYPQYAPQQPTPAYPQYTPPMPPPAASPPPPPPEPEPPPPPPPTRVIIPPAPPPRPMPPPVQTTSPVITIIPNLPDPQSGKVYRIQVGAFSTIALAQGCFDRLKAAGFTPAYEQNGNLYRVVLSSVRAADVFYTTQRLYAAGFTQAVIREESQY